MKNNKEKIFEKIKDILLKKAEGFFYNEEILEYTSENPESEKKLKNITNPVSEQLNFINKDIKSNQVSNEKSRKEKNQSFILSKKKVTTHYIPPDLLAVKMLIEIFGQEVSNELESLTEEQLENLKQEIIEKLKY